MPFQSKKQWNKFFAMANRGEISMAKAKEWARETKTPYEDLPKTAGVKQALDLGIIQAFTEAGLVEKRAALETMGSGLLRRILPIAAPAGLGAAVAGPEYRLEGAAAGLGASLLGRRLMRQLALRGRLSGEQAQLLRGLKPETRAYRKLLKTHPDIKGAVTTHEQDIPLVDWARRIGAGLLGGEAVRRYTQPNLETLNQLYQRTAPPAVDITGHYTGLEPEYGY